MTFDTGGTWSVRVTKLIKGREYITLYGPFDYDTALRVFLAAVSASTTIGCDLER